MRLVLFLAGLLALDCNAQVNLVPFSSGWSRISEIRNAGDDRLFIVNQFGQIFIMDLDGNVNADPFLDISSRVNYIGGEMGMLGLAFSPAFASDKTFYVNYTGVGGHTRISRFRVSDANPDSAIDASEEVLLLVNQPYPNHNGGSLHFGNDGYLYCSLGDGGSGGDPDNRAQNLLDTLGKILRIDVAMDSGFVIPPDNPFTGDPSACDLVWAYGLRNPWRISFDRLTGRLWISDVGQQKIEEINMEEDSLAGGRNYGWRCYEGSIPYDTVGCPPSAGMTFPVYEYPHTGPVSGCSVTGGYVYRGARYKDMFGKYFLTDFCTDEIYSLRDSAGIWVAAFEAVEAGQGFGTFGEDVFGNLYVAGANSGNIFRLESTTCDPVAFIGLEDTIVACDGPVQLTTPFDSAFTYQWYMDGLAVAGVQTHTIMAAQSGSYSVAVTSDTCTSQSPPVFVDRCLVAINPLAFYPNPAGDEVAFIIPANGGGTATLTVYDARGALCLKADIPLNGGEASRYRVDTRGWAAGMYMARMEAASQRYKGKFVVLRPPR